MNFVLNAPVTGCATGGCIPPPYLGMVGWWPLDEVNGATAFADFSGSGNNALVESGGASGSPGSPSWVAGEVGGANYFYSPTVRGRAPNVPSLNFGTGNFAADCWVKPVLVGPTAWQPIVDKLNTPTPSTTFGYAVGIVNNRVVLRVGNGTLQTIQSSGNLVNFNTWNFIAVSVDRNAATVTFHVNGVDETPQLLSLPGTINNTNHVLIGGTYDNTDIYGELALDEVELFNRTLATTEMDALWNAGSAGKCKTNRPCLQCPPTSLSVTGCPPRLPDFSTYSFAGPNCTNPGPLTVTQTIPPATPLAPGNTTVIVNVCDALGNCRSCDVVLTAVFSPGCNLCPCPTNNLIVNGSFEDPPFTLADCQQLLSGSTLMPGWTVGIDEIARCQFAPPYNIAPSSGALFADLTGFTDALPHGALTQTVATTVGQCYHLTMDLGVNLDWPGLLDGPITVKVTAGAATQFFTHNPPPGTGTVWSNYGFVFTASGPSTIITIQGIAAKNMIGVDNVSLVCSCACSNSCVVCPAPTLTVTGCPPLVPDFSTNNFADPNCSAAGPFTVTQTPLAGTVLPAGVTQVSVTVCNAASGQCVTCTTAVTGAYAGTPPALTCSNFVAAIGYLSRSCAGANGITLGYPLPQVSNGALVSCSPASGSFFGFGFTVVTCVATNGCGTNQCAFTVNLLRDPSYPQCAAPPSNMVMWLKFDETNGATALNYSAGNIGVLANNPTHALGQYVINSLCFNGVNQYVQVAPYPAMQFGTGDFSVDAWVKPATLDNSVRVIVDHREENGLVTRGYSLFLWTNNVLSFQIADGTYVNYPSTLTVPADGNWHFVAVTVKRNDAQGIRFFVDGVQDVIGRNPTGHSGSVTAGPCYLFRVASRSSAVGSLFPGCIDEVELFRRAITAAELQAIYNARCGGKCLISCQAGGSYGKECWLAQGGKTNISYIYNPLLVPQTFNWTLVPLPAGPGCTQPGPTFNPSSGTVTIPGQSYGTAESFATWPPGLAVGDITCFRLVITLADGSQQVQCDSSFVIPGIRGVCVGPSAPLVSATNLEPFTATFLVEGSGAASITLSNVTAVLRSPAGAVLSTLALPAVTVPHAGGGTIELPVTFAFPEYDPGRLYQLTLAADDGTGHSEVLSSVQVVNVLPRTDGALTVKVGTGGTVIIAWPDPCGTISPDRRLEETAQFLGSATVWTIVTNAPTTADGTTVITLPNSHPRRFYRFNEDLH